MIKTKTSCIRISDSFLLIEIVVGTNTISYIYNATGQKASKIVNEATTITQTNYLAGGFQYKNNVLQFFPHAEGYVKHEANNYSYVFNYTDHLGNVRVSYSDMDKNGRLGNEKIVDCSPPNPETGAQNCLSYFISSILEESHYYPFGLKHSGYTYTSQSSYLYKYNGKELQTELGLNLYDYGARNYDAAIGRWMNIDPLAEKFTNISMYTYVADNPIFYLDPDGQDIYRYDDKTGALILEEVNDDKFDQIAKFKYDKKNKKYIVKRGKNGDAKITIDEITKGILKDGINFKENNNLIEVGKEGQPTEKDVKNFIVQFSDKIAGKEISGYGMGESVLNDVTSGILVWAYKGNTWKSATDVMYDKDRVIRISHRGDYKGVTIRFAKYHFHTHPSSGENFKHALSIDEPSEKDKIHKTKAKVNHFIFNKNGEFQY